MHSLRALHPTSFQQFSCAVTLATLLGWGSLGCSESETGVGLAADPRMQAFTNLYCQFLQQHSSRQPKDAQELKRFIQSQGPGALQAADVANVDELFLSARDGQPLVVFYGPQHGPEVEGGLYVVAYEQQGKAGDRLIGFHRDVVAEVDEAAFNRMIQP